MSEKKKDNIDFEFAMKRLDEISNALTSEGVSLEESLALYEEGVALVRACNKKLDATERKIKMLKTEQGGEVSEVDFSADVE